MTVYEQKFELHTLQFNTCLEIRFCDKSYISWGQFLGSEEDWFRAACLLGLCLTNCWPFMTEFDSSIANFRHLCPSIPSQD